MQPVLTTSALAAALVALSLFASAQAADAPTASPAPGAAAPGAAAAETSGAVSGTAALAGRWIVDLRPTPSSPKYDKEMVLTISPDQVVTGSFYDSEIQAGRASASNGRVCFAFRTTDGVGPYHTSGCLVDGRILGQTWAEHRNFVLNWSAVGE